MGLLHHHCSFHHFIKQQKSVFFFCIVHVCILIHNGYPNNYMGLIVAISNFICILGIC